MKEIQIIRNGILLNHQPNIMNIKEIRSAFKKAVIMGCHPECETYEEALKLEASQNNCKFIDLDNIKCVLIGKVLNRSPIEKKSEYRYQMMDAERWGAEKIFSVYETGITTIKDYKIIGLPVTIGRLMQALEEKEPTLQHRFLINCSGKLFDTFIDKSICTWKLTEDGKELTDNEQTDETIEAFYNLLIS